MTNNSNNVSLFELAALTDLIRISPQKVLTAGTKLFHSGAFCEYLPLLESGMARVYASDDSDRQVTLYRLNPGEICTLSLSTLLQNRSYPAAAVAETDSKVRCLNAEAFKSLVVRDPELFAIFLGTFADCLCNSVCTTRRLLFDPLDVRLAQFLSDRFSDRTDQTLHVTHDEIAKELGTTRVVTSRLLKQLERANCIQLCRRKIRLIDPTALKELIRRRTRIASVGGNP